MQSLLAVMAVMTLLACGGDRGRIIDPLVDPAVGLSISPPELSLIVGGEGFLTARAYDAKDRTIAVSFAWSSADPAIASVGKRDGSVIAIAVGTTTVTATGGGVSGVATVTVVPPHPFAGLVFSRLDIGGSHNCGLEAPTGLAYCWGDNHGGALGAGQVDFSDFPLLVSGARRFSVLSVGLYATCGIEEQTGFAYCWGYNAFGELGDGTQSTRWVPTVVASGRIRFSDISASWGLTCGVEALTGLGYCWGRGGQTGDGTPSQRSTPTLIGSGSLRFSRITVGDVNDYGEGVHACGLEAQTGLAYCWGLNNVGQLGDGTTTPRLQPTLVGDGRRRFNSIDAGHQITCGIEVQTEAAFCWGQNTFGQLGDGTTTDRRLPTRVADGGRRFASVEAGDLTCGIEAQTSAGYCWGRNNPVPALVGEGLRFSSMNASYGRACGVEAQNGRGYCWDYQQLVPTLLSLTTSPAPTTFLARPRDGTRPRVRRSLQ